METIMENGYLCVTVADDGPGFSEENRFHPGHALDNIRKRLLLIYGDKASLTASRNQESGETELIYRLPGERVISG